MKKKVNILLVDDRPEGLVTLEAVLRNPEYNLIKAKSGREALAQILVNDFAVILMDVQMPVMDGFETTSIIKQREKSKNIPIIFMTANNKDDHFVSTGYSVGAVDYVLKPFDSHILKSKVSVFADLYQKNQLLREQSEALREIERRDRLRVLTELESEGRRRYQNLADAIPQIVFRASEAGNIEYLNQFWYSYTGQTSKEPESDQWRKYIHPVDVVEIEQKWKESAKTQTGFECECRLKQHQGDNYRWHLLRIVPEFNGMTQLVSWIGVATDIHDQKLVQQELLNAKKLADAASETKSNFLANMSHEIRTPLGIILGFSELLIDSKSSEEDRSNAISAIRRNGEQLSKIIDEILDLSKVEAGKIDVEKAEIQTVDLLHGIKQFMDLPAKEKGLDLKFRTNGRIPTKIFSNATRMQQIFVNLIGNAIKFSPRGEVIVTISYEEHEDKKGYLKAIVKDSGPGLTAKQIEHLFKPFSQVDMSMTRKHGGTGLGLVLSRRLARALGGDIVVYESKPGEGCELIVTVPTGNVDKEAFTDSLEVAPISHAPKVERGSDTLKGVSVLLVEDSIDNQVLVSHFLTMEGAKVELANNGVEGVDKAIAGDHDVVLMDIQMPELDGYGAISKLRKRGFVKPIISLTAHGMIEDKQRCIDVGSSSHLTKPVNRMALIERVRQFADLSENQQLSNIH